MSVIFGIFKRDGSPVKADELLQMQAAFGTWKPDHQSIWTNENCGIGLLQTYETPEAPHFPLPYHDPITGCTFVIECRLDNRGELIKKLDVPISESRIIADEELAYLAYRKWGSQCTQYLLGDWSFCVWDPKRQTLFLARDQLGMTALSYYSDTRFFAFASNKKALLNLPQIPKEPNLLRIAQTFAFFRGDMEQTAHKGIYRLPPSHQLEVGRSWQNKFRYYKIEETPIRRFSSQEEASEAMMELYQQAVISRLRPPKGAALSLSSGLDSASIAALAAEHLQKSGKSLKCLTSIPAYPCPDYGDESPLVREIAQMWPNLDVQYFKAEAVSPVQKSLNTIEHLAEPIGLSDNYYWLDTFLELSKQQDLNTVLVGDAGNLTVSYNGVARFLSTRELIRRRHYKLALKKILTPYQLKQLRARLRLKKHLNSILDLDFINPELLKESGFFEKFETNGWNALQGIAKSSRDIRLAYLAPSSDALFTAFSAERANSYGMDYADPTRDLRLTEFCLNTPEPFYLSSKTDRALIKHKLDQRLPRSVVHQKKVANQSLDLLQRLLSCKSEVLEILDRLEAHNLTRSFVDLQILRNHWSELSHLNSNTPQTLILSSNFLRRLTCAFFIYAHF